MGITLKGYDEKNLRGLINIHKEAFREHYNSKVGKIYIRGFLRWFGNNKDAVFVQAIDDESGKAVGYICGAKYGYSTQMNKELLPYIILSFLARPWIIIDKRFFTLIMPKLKIMFSGEKIADDEYPDFFKTTFSAVSWAVDSKNTRKEVSGLLYDEFLKEVRSRGYNSVRGTVLKKNRLALVYYIHNKWSILKNKSNKETITIYKKL